MSKIILITGSTDGIGKLAAIKLAKEGHTILVHGRNDQKLNQTVSEIREVSGNSNIQGFVADFSDLNSVTHMASEIRQDLSQLDVLINNAGVFKSKTASTENGMDIRFVVNYLAPYLLTRELTPLLEKSSRVINLSSAAQAPVSLEALRGTEHLSDQSAYAQSKLALTMWSFALAKMVDCSTFIAVNPGSLLNTKMAMEAYGQHWSSADKGANILYDLAISETYHEMTGKYFDNDKGTVKGAFAAAHADAYDQEKVTALLTATDSILADL
ncbi:MAG: SDR family NAD(P)-dependent oxidoreductase [Roseivirga sp.]|nr:SDR family NAD(P)-dependent oxidoreductase [Roseivirga sp.]